MIKKILYIDKVNAMNGRDSLKPPRPLPPPESHELAGFFHPITDAVNQGLCHTFILTLAGGRDCTAGQPGGGDMFSCSILGAHAG